MAYTNQKVVSSYILLRVKPKLPDVKTGSRRFLDVTGGMDRLQLVCCVSLLSRSRYFEDRCVYVCPTSRREAARLKDEAGKFPVAHEDK